ncbi:MAG: family 20 glycosylhydrolase, partial [Muribaculaceae bacterium]|nr:family 20 glycosylhydrolase [Muribaculaceae bacterium]
EVLCAGNDSVYNFLTDIMEELIDIFPSEVIHIGGDECPKVRWAACPKCQAKAKSLGLRTDSDGSREAKLQNHVMAHVSEFLRQHGRRVIGWDEILDADFDKEAIIMSWRGESGGIAGARKGHDVVMTPNHYLYFDYYQTRDTANEPLAIGGYVPLQTVYGYEPVPEALSPEERKHIIGVQANLWTEYIPDFPHVQYMALPRMAALSEIQWTDGRDKDYPAFLGRLRPMLDRYDRLGYRYSTRAFDDADQQPEIID